MTGPNGDYTVTAPRPTVTPPATLPQTFTLKASGLDELRRVGSKKKGKKQKKGRQVFCLGPDGQSSPVTFSAP